MQIKDERNKVIDKARREKRPVSKEEYASYKKRSNTIMQAHKIEAQIAADEAYQDMGLDDLKRADKELRDELITKDIKNVFCLKELFKK